MITDALSRAPLAKPTSIDESLHSEVEVYLDTHYQPLRNRLQISCITRKLMKFVNNLFPTVLLHVQAMLISKAYYPIAPELTVVNGVLMRGTELQYL